RLQALDGDAVFESTRMVSADRNQAREHERGGLIFLRWKRRSVGRRLGVAELPLFDRIAHQPRDVERLYTLRKAPPFFERLAGRLADRDAGVHGHQSGKSLRLLGK